MLAADLSVSITGRRLACVLDPLLLLSPSGLTLARQLSGTFDVWMVREWWHILDNSEFYRQRVQALWPRALGGDVTLSDDTGRDIGEALSSWERIRARNDLAGLKLFWIGDGVSESMLAEGTDVDVVGRYEQLAAALDRRGGATEIGMATALRDAVALAAALGNAFVLAASVPGASAPRMASVLREWGLSCARVPDQDPLARIEREYMHRALLQSGVLPLVWAGMGLTAMRVVVPAASALFGAAQLDVSGDGETIDLMITALAETTDLWRGAHAFWNPLTTPSSTDSVALLEDRRYDQRSCI